MKPPSFTTCANCGKRSQGLVFCSRCGQRLPQPGMTRRIIWIAAAATLVVFLVLWVAALRQ